MQWCQNTINQWRAVSESTRIHILDDLAYQTYPQTCSSVAFYSTLLEPVSHLPGFYSLLTYSLLCKLQKSRVPLTSGILPVKKGLDFLIPQCLIHWESLMLGWAIYPLVTAPFYHVSSIMASMTISQRNSLFTVPLKRAESDSALGDLPAFWLWGLRSPSVKCAFSLRTIVRRHLPSIPERPIKHTPGKSGYYWTGNIFIKKVRLNVSRRISFFKNAFEE